MQYCPENYTNDNLHINTIKKDAQIMPRHFENIFGPHHFHFLNLTHNGIETEEGQKYETQNHKEKFIS